MRIRFITATPMNVLEGSGTFVGITTLAKALRGLGVGVDVVAPKRRFPVYTVERLAFNQMLRLRRSRQWDVTVGFDMDGYAVSGAGPYIASIKGVIADEMRFESGLTRATMWLQAICERLNVHRAGLVVTTSCYASERVQELYGLGSAPSIVPEAIDLSAWRDLSKTNPTRADPHRFVILTVCRFYRRKRLHILLGAAERLRSKIDAFHLRIVGGGPEFPYLQRLCRQKRLEEVVTWCGNVSQPQLSNEYNRCQVFCLPSVQEGFGVVFLEAMAHGKPIVAARAGAAPEVVRHGLLVEPDSETAIADAIEFLYHHPSVCAQLGGAGLEFVSRFDAPIVAKLFLQEVERCAGMRAVPAG